MENAVEQVEQSRYIVFNRAALSVPDVMESTGLCREMVYREIRSGALRSFKVGNRRLISPDALMEWIRSLEAAEAQKVA
jgi:excisionase family DNA binding protein